MIIHPCTETHYAGQATEKRGSHVEAHSPTQVKTGHLAGPFGFDELATK
jgi:hypothetical protein